MTRSISPRQTVLRVLAYAAVFGSSVSWRKLSRFQVQTEFSGQELQVAAQQLIDEGVVRKIPTSSSSSVIREKWRVAQEGASFFSLFPWIESVWVTGGLAVGNILPEDDVDFMLITSERRLWLTRFLVMGLGSLLGRVRRRHDLEGAVRNKWCCNLWIEVGATELALDQRSLYAAREVLQAVPLWKRAPIVEGFSDFLRSNAWVAPFFPVAYRESIQRFKKASRLPRPLWERWIPVLFLNLLNSALFRWQLRRLAPGKQHEIVEFSRAFFHPGERAQHVQRQYERILRLYSISP